MKALRSLYPIFVCAIFVLTQACGDDKEKGTKNNTTPNITSTTPTDFGNNTYDPYYPTATGGTFNGGAPVIQVTGSAAPTSVQVPVGQPATINFNISNVGNINDVQMVLKNNPGGQLQNMTSLNPSFYWQSPMQGTYQVTLLVRNMQLCSQQAAANQCQLSPTSYANPAYDAEQTIVLNVGAGGAGYPNGNNNPYYPNGTNNPYYPNGTNNPYYPNGTNNPYYPNGTNNPYYPNGTNNPYYPNGTNNPYYPNGTNNPYYPNGGLAGNPQASQIMGILNGLGVNTSNLNSLEQLYIMAQSLGIFN